MKSHPAVALFVLLAAASGCSNDGRESSPTGPGPGVPGISGESLPETAFDTVITAGPADGSTWEQSAATFHWVSPGARHWGWTLLTAEEYSSDTGLPFRTADVIAWAETLSFHPDLHGGYDVDRPAWIAARETVARVTNLTPWNTQGGLALYCFAVRAVDHDVVEPLAVPDRFRRFNVAEPAGSVALVGFDVPRNR